MPRNGHARMTARATLVLVSAFALSGCLHSSTLIRVRPDGSGTVEQRLMFSSEGIEKAFAGMGFKSTGATATKKSTPITEAQLETDLADLGEGVTLVSMAPISEARGFEGIAVKLAFTDIAALRTEEFLLPSPAAKEKGGNGVLDGIRFAVAPGADGTAVLTATFHETERKGTRSSSQNSAKGGKGRADLNDPEMRQMVKAMFQGFRIGLDLEIEGQIVRTNADHVNGSRITLAEIDLEALLREGKKLEALDKVLSPNASIAKMRPYLKDMKGLRINHPVVTVEFR